MKKTTKAAQMPPSITLRLSRGRSVKITWRPRQRVSSLLVKLLTKALAIFLPLSMSAAHALDVNALPTGGQVTAGSATINQAGNTLNINQASQKAALNWQNFNIGTNSTVNFVQPNSNAVALNRIGGNSASEIYGHLNANGQVFMMNPNGILFARGSQVNVGAIVATTMQLGDADFLAGNYNFSNAGVGSVANYGLINATNSVVLLGSDVSNQGSIFATTASLVSGNTVALDVSTDGLIRARVVDAAVQANIANSGDINATQVTLSAGQAKDTLNRVVNNSGVIKATGFSSLNGEITLQGGTTLNSGTLDATSATGNGGTVHMLGQHVGLIDSGSIDVSGATGGGTILVGGDYQGKNASIENAEVTYVGAQTTLKADATQNGNGGKVIVWADDTTRAYGSISAQGGALGGDGGFVETSGHRYLDVNGARVNTLALHGLTGNWLLDPRDVTIEHNPGGGTNEGGYTNNPDFLQAFNTAATIYDTTINSALNASNVTITTDNTSNTTTSGDITFDSTNGNILISTNGSDFSRTLILNASRDIAFTGGNDTSFQSSLFSTVPIGLDVTLNATGTIKTDSGSSVTLDGAASSVGTVIVRVPSAIEWKNGGVLNINGNATVDIESGATFKNDSGAEVKVNGGLSLSGLAFDGTGDIINEGTINVNVDTAFAAAYTQQNDEFAPLTRGALTIADSVNLNLHNAISLEGEVNLNTSGILNFDEYHGTTASLTHLTIAGGTLNVAGNEPGNVGDTPIVSFSDVTARTTVLNVSFDDIHDHDAFYPGEAIIEGNTIFNNVNFVKNNPNGVDGRFEIINAKLGVTNSFVVPADVIYTGDVGYYATGDLTIYNDISVTTDTSLHNSLSLMAGWDGISLDLPAVSGSVSRNLIFDRFFPNPPPIVSAVGNINLDASGYISQDFSSAAIITQDTLIVNAVDGISLDGDNQVSTFRATNTGTGDIDFYNVGDVAFDNISNQASGGYVDVESGGGISQYGNIDTDGGDITVYAANDIDMNPDGVRSATINNSTSSNFIRYESSDGNFNLGLLDAGAGTVHITAGLNILDGNGTANNIKATYASLIAGDSSFGGTISGIAGAITADTQVAQLIVDNEQATAPGQTVSIRNTGSVLLVDAYTSADFILTNNNTINVDDIYAVTGITVISGGDINVMPTNNLYSTSIYTFSGDQNITAAGNITLAGGVGYTYSPPPTYVPAYVSIEHGAGAGSQIINLKNGGTLSLTGGTGAYGNYARIENNSTDSASVQKIWSSVDGISPNPDHMKYPNIVMLGGSAGGLPDTPGHNNSNGTFIESGWTSGGIKYGTQQIYAGSISLDGGAGDYAGAIISSPNQQIIAIGDVTLRGGSSSSLASSTGDTFLYKGVTYTIASPAAIGDKDNLSQILDIGGRLRLDGGSGNVGGTSRLAMVGSLNGLATGSIKANAIELNSGASNYNLAMLGGVQDIIVTSTFKANIGSTSGHIEGNAWSIWAPNPTAITGCGAGTGCFADFAQYGVTFGSTPAPTILGTGHGWLYSAAAPALTATTSTNYSRVYDGTANAYLAATDFTVTGTNVGETAALTNITGNFANKNVGTAKAISSSAAAFSVTAASGIPVYGYATPTISGLTANITPSSIIAVSGITAANRVYDSTTLATLTTSGASFAGMFSGDNLSVASATGTFIDKNVATGKAVNITGITLGGSDLGNYILVNSTANTTANITPATLNWSVADATGNTGTIPVPGLATLSVIFGSDVVTGVVSAYDTNNVFAILSAAMPEGVYTEKVTGLTGTDAGNYSLASTGTTGVLTVNKSVITPEVEQEVTAVTSETISQPEDTQIKQEEDEIKAPEKVLVASNFVDDPKANNENPVETEKPKGRTLQCSVSK